MRETCRICDQEVKSDGHFWKTHKIKMADYYIKYYHKVDLYTQEPIPFKSREQYLLARFINRTNLSNYLKTLNEEVSQQFCIDLLSERQTIKGLTYAPTQVELRTLIMPTMMTYNRLFGNYYDVCSNLKLKLRFPARSLGFKPQINEKYLDGKYYINIDTREQIPIRFDYPVQVATLPYGDYSFLNNKVFVERKNLIDFISTMSSGYERFHNEIIRARNNHAYLVIVVEALLSYALNFNYSKWVTRFVQASSEFIFHRVRELLQSYDNIQFVFMQPGERLSKLVKLILLSDGLCKDLDLQYLIENDITFL